MTESEMLELAAKALGRISSPVFYKGIEIYWNPATSHEDSDKMACDLEIDLEFEFNSVGARHRAGSAVWVDHDGTIEGRRAAVRKVRLTVVAQIEETTSRHNKNRKDLLGINYENT